VAHHYVCSRPATTRLAHTLRGASSSIFSYMCAIQNASTSCLYDAVGWTCDVIHQQTGPGRQGYVHVCGDGLNEAALLCCRLKLWRTDPTQDGNGTDTTSVLCLPMLAKHCFAEVNDARKNTRSLVALAKKVQSRRGSYAVLVLSVQCICLSVCQSLLVTVYNIEFETCTSPISAIPRLQKRTVLR